MELYDIHRPFKKFEVRKANFNELSYYRKTKPMKSDIFDKLLQQNINGKSISDKYVPEC